MEIKAQIYSIGAVQQVTDKFKKRELIVISEPDSQYPQHIKVQLSQDKCSLADSLVSGQQVTLHVNLRGKLYTDKNGNENAITNLEVWKIEGVAVTQPSAPVQNTSEPIDDDLPF